MMFNEQKITFNSLKVLERRCLLHFILVAFLILASAYTLSGQEKRAGKDKIVTEAASKIKEIELEAFQYGFSPDPIVVKKGETVKISAVSRDVTHGFYIKEYAINAVIRKGEKTEIKFIADKVGEFQIRCSVYCGSGHMSMKGKLIVKE